MIQTKEHQVDLTGLQRHDGDSRGQDYAPALLTSSKGRQKRKGPGNPGPL